MKKVTILGGGFAGLEAAIYLKKYSFDVTLISDRDYLYIYPTSIWIPTGEASFEDNKLDLNELSDIHGFDLVIDKVAMIDAKQNNYTLEKEGLKSDFDYLILAFGASKTPMVGIENTLSICAEPKQSMLLKDKLDALIQKGSGELCFGFGGNPKDMSAVRGGPAFELIFNVHNHLKKNGLRDNFKLTFFAPMPEPGKKMGEKSLKMMDTFFKKLNINRHFGKKIKSFEQESIVFEDDTKLKSDLTMFIAAGTGN
ncbi:MAG: FAD-dependent oxidoreductase, partial [Thiovulaceae bacterium]|nr:FAD-dependent oxidoreductase [Sulfurimonadaceae bacterium]